MMDKLKALWAGLDVPYKIGIGVLLVLILMAVQSDAAPDADGPAGFTTQWHGHGDNHQGNNNPGDTAADRHNFDDATAGKSGKNPRANANGG